MTMAPPLFLALALTYAGLTSLSLAMKRHHDQVMGRKLQPERVRYYRWPGWLLLSLSLWVTLTIWPLGLALFMSVGLVAIAGLPLVFLLPYRAQLAGRLAIALPVLAMLTWSTAVLA
jgi:hypothetical protein